MNDYHSRHSSNDYTQKGENSDFDGRISSVENPNKETRPSVEINMDRTNYPFPQSQGKE